MAAENLTIIYRGNMNCIECNKPAQEQHHVIPKSLGGNATVPLCNACHARVHGLRGSRRDQHRLLTRLGFIRKNEHIRSTTAAVAMLYFSGSLPDKKKDWKEVVDEYCDLSYNSIVKKVNFLRELDENDMIEMFLDCFDDNDPSDLTLKMVVTTVYNDSAGFDAIDPNKYPDAKYHAWPELTGG
jgi:hypothetical protein